MLGPPPDTGTLAGDLRDVMWYIIEALASRAAIEALPGLMADMAHNSDLIVHAYAAGAVPEEAARLLDHYGKQTHRNLSRLIREAQVAGQVRAGDADELATLLLASIQSHGLIYRYFPSKEAAFVALVERAVRGGMELTEAALAAEASPGDRLSWLLDQMLEGIKTDPEYPLIGTIYSTTGDLFAWGCLVGLTGAALVTLKGLAVDRLEVHTRRRRFPRAQTIIELLMA